MNDYVKQLLDRNSQLAKWLSGDEETLSKFVVVGLLKSLSDAQMQAARWRGLAEDYCEGLNGLGIKPPIVLGDTLQEWAVGQAVAIVNNELKEKNRGDPR